MDSQAKVQWFYSVYAKKDGYYQEMWCHLFAGQIVEGVLDLDERLTMRWQTDEERDYWYGFGIQLSGTTSQLTNIEQSYQLLKRFDKHLQKSNELYYHDGFTRETRPFQVRQALEKFGIRQVVRDDRSGQWVLVDEVKPDGYYYYWTERGPYGYEMCMYGAWAEADTQAQIMIAADWTAKMVGCQAKGYMCKGCHERFQDWVGNRMQLQRDGCYAPHVFSLPTEDDKAPFNGAPKLTDDTLFTIPPMAEGQAEFDIDEMTQEVNEFLGVTPEDQDIAPAEEFVAALTQADDNGDNGNS